MTSENHSPSAITEFAAEPFFVIEVGIRYVHVLGVTAHPDGA